MRYCPECGTKLKEINKNHEAGETKDKAKIVYHNKNGFLKAAGILTIVAASLCFIVGIIGLVAYTNGTYPGYPGDYVYTYPKYTYSYQTPLPQYILTAAFGFFVFILGLTSGILILIRKLFSLTMIGQISIMGVAILLMAVEFWFFVLLGIPILVMTALSIVFTSVSKNEFVS